jgi:hypothetical protein
MLLGERLEAKRDRPFRAAREKVGASDAEEQDGRAGREQRDVLDQIEERLLGPMEVVEEADKRCLLLEQLAEGPSDLLSRGPLIGLAEQGAEGGCCGGIGRKRVELLQRLDHRPIGDSLPVREAAAPHDLGIDQGEELGREPRLAHSRVADQSDELAATFVDCALPRLLQGLQLALSSDEQCLVRMLRRLVDIDEAESRDRLSLSLHLERIDRLCLDRLADELESRLANEDLARLGSLLQASSDVDGIPGRKALLRAGDDLAGVEADAGLDSELGQRVAHLDGCSHRTERIVLVHLGGAEHGHHGVSDELLHCPAVRLDDSLHALEVAGEEGAQGLRVRRLTESGRARDVTEENGHGLALLARGGRDGERSGALLAEPRAVAVLVAAGRTDPHAFRLNRSRRGS